MSRKKIALGAVVIVIVIAAIAAGSNSTSTAGASPTPNASDTQLAGVLSQNILDEFGSDTDWYPMVSLNANNKPDVAVRGDVAYVVLRPSATASQIAIACTSVLAVTNDPNTAQPLGITTVVVGQSNQTVKTCSHS